jgi:hypothetical protein
MTTVTEAKRRLHGNAWNFTPPEPSHRIQAVQEWTYKATGFRPVYHRR